MTMDPLYLHFFFYIVAMQTFTQVIAQCALNELVAGSYSPFSSRLKLTIIIGKLSAIHRERDPHSIFTRPKHKVPNIAVLKSALSFTCKFVTLCTGKTISGLRKQGHKIN